MGDLIGAITFLQHICMTILLCKQGDSGLHLGKWCDENPCESIVNYFVPYSYHNRVLYHAYGILRLLVELLAIIVPVVKIKLRVVIYQWSWNLCFPICWSFFFVMPVTIIWGPFYVRALTVLRLLYYSVWSLYYRDVSCCYLTPIPGKPDALTLQHLAKAPKSDFTSRHKLKFPARYRHLGLSR